MGLRTKTPLTEQIIALISGIEDALDFPRSMRQLVYRHEYEHFKLKKRRSDAQRREQTRIKEALWRLEKAEFVTAQKGAVGATRYRLTPKGWLKFALHYSSALTRESREEKAPNKSIQRGSYVIIFDIPETYRRFRDTLRDVLINLGCQPLQKSIFITAHPKTIKFVARIIANCELEDRVKILLVKSIL